MELSKTLRRGAKSEIDLTGIALSRFSSSATGHFPLVWFELALPSESYEKQLCRLIALNKEFRIGPHRSFSLK